MVKCRLLLNQDNCIHGQFQWMLTELWPTRDGEDAPDSTSTERSYAAAEVKDATLRVKAARAAVALIQ